MCMGVLFAHMYGPRIQEEGTGSPGAAVIGGCEVLNTDAGNHTVIALFKERCLRKTYLMGSVIG